MFQDEGASTDVTGMEVVERASMTEGNGSRTSPENEKPGRVNDFEWRRGLEGEGIGDELPNIASTTWSVSLRAAGKSSVNGILKFLSCVERRFEIY